MEEENSSERVAGKILLVKFENHYSLIVIDVGGSVVCLRFEGADG
jgi:hypothetical protein